MATNGQKQNAWTKFMVWYESYQGKKIVGMVYSIGASVVIVGALFKILHWPGAKEMLMVGMFTEALLFAIGCLDKPHAEFQWHMVFPQLVGKVGTDPAFYDYVQTLPQPNLAAITGGTAKVADSAAQKANVPALTDKDMEALKGSITDLAKTAGQLSELGKVATSTTKLGEKLDAASEAAEKFTASQTGLLNATATLGTAASALGEKYTAAATDMQKVVADTKSLTQSVETTGQKLSALNAVYELQIAAAQSQVEAAKAQAEAYKAQTEKVNSLGAGVEKLQAAQAEAIKNTEAYEAGTKKLAAQVADLNKVYGNMLNALA